MRRTCFLLTALLAACALPTGGDDDPNVAYDVDRASYGRDQAVSTVMVNHTGEVAGYNLCIATLERRVGGGFRCHERRVHARAPRGGAQRSEQQQRRRKYADPPAAINACADQSRTSRRYHRDQRSPTTKLRRSAGS